LVTPSGSNRNRASSDNPFLGAYQTRSGRWCAKLKWQGQRHYIGMFDTREEAAAAAAEYRRVYLPDSIEISEVLGNG
jgi:hypothetical protein